MKPTSEILERIEKCSSEHKDGVFTRLYRYLLREDIYYAAYQKLYANKGATTQGIDDDTADGFSDFYVKELIQSLKDGTYKANPVRREYIPKKNGKLRPLGIPSFRDKLLQEVVRMILEAIYEPVFDSHSHGFRPGKSCHTALRQISSDFTGVVWFIEGDIQGCFDNINHEKLIEILSRKIKDSRFLNIIRQFLKAGYIENWKYNATYSGSPQGGICSPTEEPAVEEKVPETEPEEPMLPLTPDGNLTLVDDAGSPTKSGKQFITAVTKNGNYFYIIIDRDDKGEETVHFLNQVDEADLLKLMDEEEVAEFTKPVEETKPEVVETVPEITEPTPEEKPKSTNMLPAILTLIVLACGGGFFVFKKVQEKKKAQEAAKPDPDADYVDDDEDYGYDPEFEDDDEDSSVDEDDNEPV